MSLSGVPRPDSLGIVAATQVFKAAGSPKTGVLHRAPFKGTCIMQAPDPDLEAALAAVAPGECLNPEPDEGEAAHFMICPTCSQAFDMRDLGAVFHHAEAEHEPIRPDA